MRPIGWRYWPHECCGALVGSGEQRAIAPGVAYELRQPGTAVPTQVTFKILEGVPDETMGIAQALIENECEDQLELLLAAAPAE